MYGDYSTQTLRLGHTFFKKNREMKTGKNVISRFLCWVGIHQWKEDLVMTKKKFEHCRGVEEIGHDKKANWHDGRSCKRCKRKQYFYYYWVSCGYQNVL